MIAITLHTEEIFSVRSTGLQREQAMGAGDTGTGSGLNIGLAHEID